MNAGKGKRPIIGYDFKKWNRNFDEINWHHSSQLKVVRRCERCGCELSSTDADRCKQCLATETNQIP